MAKQLLEEDHRRIAEAIAAAEAGTSGEIYCVVAGQASAYRWVPVAVAVLAALVTPFLVALLAPAAHRWPVFGETWTSGNLTTLDIDHAVSAALQGQAVLQIIVFAVVLALALPRAVRLVLTPRGIKRGLVHQAALQQFLAHGLQRTRGRTGILIYVALAERQAVLLADEGINAKVSQTVWDEAIGALTHAAGTGRIADGFVTAIGQCGAVLARHFPPEPDDVNELPDRIVEL